MSDLEELHETRQRLTQALAQSRRETNQTQAELKALKKKIDRAKLEAAEPKRWWSRLWFRWRSNADLRRENRELRTELKRYRAARGIAEKVLMGSELREAARAWVVAVHAHKDPRKWVDVELADLGAAIFRRFVRVGLFGLAVAALPLMLLGWQNVLIREQNAAMQAQNETISKQVDQQAEDTLIVRRAQLLDTIYACKDEPQEAEQEPKPEDTEQEPKPEDAESVKATKSCEPRAHIRARQEAVLAFVQIERDRGERANLYGAILTDATLIGANLSGANLNSADLADAILAEADVSEANLIRTNLSETDLSEANLTNAYLVYANLRGNLFFDNADLTRATLAFAFLTGADLSDATLTDANLRRANLHGADLSYTTGLTQDQINAAYGDHTTRLPDHLTHPDHWPKAPENTEAPDG